MCERNARLKDENLKQRWRRVDFFLLMCSLRPKHRVHDVAASFILFLTAADDYYGTQIIWYKPPPVEIARSSSDMFAPNVSRHFNGQAATLLWEFRLSQNLSFTSVTVKFNSDTIVRLLPNGGSGGITAAFRDRFSVNWNLPGRVALVISKVTSADDKVNGAFSCVVATLSNGDWERKIQVEIVGPVYVEKNCLSPSHWYGKVLNRDEKILKNRFDRRLPAEQTQFTGKSGDQFINENSDRALFCNTTGKPLANVTWTRVLDDGSNGDEVFVGNPWFIRDIKRTMNGTYRCTASNGFGNALTHAMHVNVTYSPQIENFQHELPVAAFQIVTLQCPAEGNPPPKYTWYPCKKGEVCDEPKLNLGEVSSDGIYTCNVTNSLGSDAESVVLSIAAKTVNISLRITSEKCTGGKYDTSSMKEKLSGLMDIIFKAQDLDYNSAEVTGYRCGSVTVYMALKFNSITKEKDVIARIRTAVENGTTGGFTFNVSSITGTRIPPEKATTVPTSPTGSPGEVHTNECQDTERDRGYASADHQYAVTGPNATYRASNPSSSPLATYEIANRESEGRRGRGASAPNEPLPEYAVVNKTKKKKRTPKPGELQYAELGDLTGRGKKATLPPVSGTSTVYAEVN
ncbi:Immunoglobulin superfamily member 10 [Stylophora pistillata]|uniref:Immunoglobulin superfamily member 10 n=1 Tax=Stylophora pistillata TaxID=50429 RepID=A0A2B4S1N4_STYPI|nr:Immunoglobulin superfamily member 10 [Stylophora pistillata]